jgi:hypothetical protein|tara:strand:- start:681 stop:989 length:309 start_codon:yes stop_codon:yes gene_type:complete
MAIKAKRTRIVVDEMAKFSKGEIEFLFETIKNSMIPGKFLPIAMDVVQKLKTQYKLLNREDFILKKEDDVKQTLKQEIEKAQQETFQRMKKVDGELYIEDDE